jgi:protein phosphatase
MQIELGADSHPGKVREHNEDCCEVVQWTGRCAAILCDGMGGHAAGDVASRIATGRIAAELVAGEHADPRELVYRAVETAHAAVQQAAQSHGREGMGTTAVIALIGGDRLYLCHVGDSRAYLVRDGQELLLTRDQTRVQLMVDQGLISPGDAATHPDAGLLTQAVGQDGSIEPFVTPEPDGIPLQLNDAVVLCSDGVHQSQSPGGLVRIIAGRSATEAARALVSAAIDRDGSDNATAVVAIVRAATVAAAEKLPVRTTLPDGTPPRAPRVRHKWALLVLLGALLVSLGYLVGHSAGSSGGAEVGTSSQSRYDGASPPDRGIEP